MDSYKEIPFSSFLAGVLMVNSNIGNLELSELMSRYQFETCTQFSEDKLDFNFEELFKILIMDVNGFRLIVKYDDIIMIKNKKVCVYDYLYSLTDESVRYFLNIPERKSSHTNIKK